MANGISRVSFSTSTQNLPSLIDVLQKQYGVTSFRIEEEAAYPDKRIFMNYRRQDSMDICGRIWDRLIQAFGRSSVFRDVASIQPGANWREVVTREVTGCDVMLVLMAEGWNRGRNRTRLQTDPDDFVRFEIEVALTRSIPVIPLWLGDRSTAANPLADLDDLPASLSGLLERQGQIVRRDPHFHEDIDDLIEAIKIIFRAQQEQPNS